MLIFFFRPPSGAWNNTAKSPSKSSITGDTEALITEEEPPKGCWDSFTRGIGGKILKKNGGKIQND